MMRRPDEDYDIVVYECRGIWTIWLGGENRASWSRSWPRSRWRTPSPLCQETGLVARRDRVSAEANQSTHPGASPFKAEDLRC